MTEQRPLKMRRTAYAAAEDPGPTHAELLALAARLMAAQEEERRGIAHQLHDDVGQRASILEMRLQAAMQALAASPDELQSILAGALAEAEGLGDALRNLSQRVYPAVIEHLGLAPAIRALAAEHREQGGAITVTLKPLPAALPLDVATAVYRIAEEALSNVRRHAPGARARLTLVAAGAELRLTIADSGPGFDAAAVRPRAFGLLIMRERARMVNAGLTVDSAHGKGCRIELRAPLK